MKNTYQLLGSFLFVFIVLLAVQNKANAQCALISRDASFTETTTSIDCNFPIYETTGDPLADQTARQAWIVEIQATYPEWRNMTASYFLVHQSDLAAMTASRQAALTACPSVHIVP